MSIAAATRSLFEPRVASRMRTGSTDVKNCAAIVIDRSNTSIRESPAAPCSTIRPGHRSSSQRSGPLHPGRQPTHGDVGSRPRRIVGRPGDRDCQALRSGSPSFGSIGTSSRRSLGLERGRGRLSGAGGGSDSGFPEIRGRAQRPRGSASTKSALVSRLNGTASSAPTGPTTHVQNTRDRNVNVGERPTESPTTRGWMMDWITKLMTL